MDKYQNKYRISSARLQNWDYRWSAAYFITICTQNRNHYFGHIADGKMQLSPIGIIANILWYEIKNHTKNIELGEFVVMPNHIHGILILTGNNGNNEPLNEPTIKQTVEQSPKSIGQQRFQNIGKNSVSSIIGSYKSAVSKHAHRLDYNFEWQPRFHDHIIRDNQSYQNISKYIINNPANWIEDKFHKE